VSPSLRLIHEYGFALVFANVFATQIGVPVPAYPALLISGALAARGQFAIAALLATAVAACLLADTLWYLAGRRFGSRILRRLCQIAITPDGCVRQTESIFARWGAPALMVAKFIPGFASVATAMAGSTRVSSMSFLGFDAVGATLWSGVGLALGWLFEPVVVDVIDNLGQMGRWGALVVLIALGAFVATRLWSRHRFRAKLRMDRITVHALAKMLAEGASPVIVDVRFGAGGEGGRIPGALVFHDDEWPKELRAPSDDAVVVVYCACPGEASAALVAKKLMQRGFKHVWPLMGGVDAWTDAGFRLEFASGGSAEDRVP
jgi:membrane protein DedA with SNARE-associated domain/rhodanese-related sulfurtransferase